MGRESKWIKENVSNCDKGDIIRRLKLAINFKTNQNEVLKEEEDAITGNYTLLGFSIKELGKTARVMFGYEGNINRLYADYLAQALTDRLREVFEFDVLEEEDFEALVAYGEMLMEEIEKLCAIDVCYTLDGLYKVFK